MNEERYVAAIEISSSKIIGAIGRTRGAGQLDVIAVEQERGVECVRYGIIQNLEETSLRVDRVLRKLERRPGVAPRKISGVYVGLSGRSIRSISSETSLTLPDDTEITDDIIARLRQQALSTAIDSSLEVVDAVPRSYFIGRTETRSPKGAVGNGIRSTFDLVVCRPELKRNITRTLPEKLGVKVRGFVVTALATGHLILSEEEKRLGCMLADIGAETTTVTIYRNGHLVYFATLPLGGRNITRDLTSLNLLEERAEEIKTVSGNAIASDTASNLNLNGIKHSDVSNIIVARSEEIVANIVEQVTYAGLKDSDLPGGIVCIGGGAALNGFTELLHRQSNLTVRRGQLPPYVRLEETRLPASDVIEVVSILYAGATLDGDAECLRSEAREGLPRLGEGNDPEPDESAGEEADNRLRTERRHGIFDKFRTRVTDFFKGNDEDADRDGELE